MQITYWDNTLYSVSSSIKVVKKTRTSVGKNIKKEELLYTTGGKLNGSATMENCM